MNTIAERVAAGAAFLDEREPGWDQRIDLSKLDIRSGCDCVLGQLYKGFGAGLMATGLPAQEYDQDAKLGFYWADGDCIEDLTAEWARLITGRRAS